MSDDLLDVGAGPAFERLERLSHRAKNLPPESREFIDELLEAFTVSVEELQVVAEELNQQNMELIATREELEIQRSRYRDMFEFAPDGYLVTDPVGIIRDVNQAAVKLLGISRQNLLGKPMVLYVTPEERDRFHLHLDRLIKSKGHKAANVEWEMQIRSWKGVDFPAALTVAPIWDAKDNLVGLRWLLRDITPSKRAEERERLLAQVRESNRLLQALIETMPIGTIIVNAHDLTLQTNTAANEIMGSPISGTIESPNISHTYCHLDGTPIPFEQMPLMRALKEKHPVKDVEVLIRRIDGDERILRASAAPVLDEAGKVVSAISVFQDITGRKKSREALRQYARRLQVLSQADQIILKAGTLDELVKSMLPFTRELVPCRQAAVLTFDREGNEARLLGMLVDGETSLGTGRERIPLDESWPLVNLSRGEMVILDVNSITAPQSASVKALQADDVRYIVCAPLMAQGELLGVLNIGCDYQLEPDETQREIICQIASELAIGIHQMRLREQLQRHAIRLEQTVARRTGALRESEERFRIILNAAVFGIALLDSKGRIVQSNPALQNMIGYSEIELRGMTFSDYSYPDDAEAIEQLYQTLASLETGHFQTEKRFVRKDGQARWGELTISRVKRTDSEKPQLAVAIMEDITEKKKIQESLARAERLAIAGRLGASLAHEINNPVQAVIGCLGLAEEMLEDNPNVYRYLEIAMQELERTAEIVTQLRDLGRESELKEKEPTELNAFIERVLLLIRKRCINQAVEVEWIPAENLPPVLLSPERMQQVLLNVILNALEAMPEGGRLQVSTALAAQPKGVNVVVMDNGAGIESERLSNIFEPFHSSRSDGLGLGLFISKNIVEEHGGRIGVESRVGTGSTFNIWLPL